QVLLLANGILVGNDLVNSLGKYTVTVSTPLKDGVYDMTAQIVDFAGNISPISAAMTPKLVINTQAPTVPTLKLDASYATPGLTTTTSAVPSLSADTSDPGTVVAIFDNGQLISTFNEGSTKNFTSLLNLTDAQPLL